MRAVTDGIIDSNNANAAGTGGTFTYQWQEANGDAKNNATDASYILTAPDIANIAAGTPPQVEVTYTDDLGFVRSWTVRVHVVEARITRTTNTQLDATLNDAGNVVADNSEGYQWQQSAAENGNYTAISGETSAAYTVPDSYGTAHPFVRVSISYTDTSATPNVVTNAVSSPIRVAGVASGTVGITPPTNVGVGGVINSDITNLTNVLNLAVRAEDLTYQWFSGDGSNWNIISSGTGASYTIVAAFFTNTRRQLSLQVTDPTGLSGPFDAPPINLQRETIGNVAIDASRLSVDATVTANTNALVDANGKSAYTYAWYYARIGGTPQVISGANGVFLCH